MQLAVQLDNPQALPSSGATAAGSWTLEAGRLTVGSDCSPALFFSDKGFSQGRPLSSSACSISNAGPGRSLSTSSGTPQPGPLHSCLHQPHLHSTPHGLGTLASSMHSPTSPLNAAVRERSSFAWHAIPIRGSKQASLQESPVPCCPGSSDGPGGGLTVRGAVA